MQKRANFLLRTLMMALALAIAGLLPQAAAQDDPKCRALLIACERFVTEPETTPAGLHNLEMIEEVLLQDLRGYDITRQYGITSSKEALAAAIRYAFRDAQEEDISLLYICTHGAFDQDGDGEGYLLLSDGALEDRVSAAQLESMLDTVPGTKMLLVDACNSGALIGKGASPRQNIGGQTRYFQSDAYKALLSSGASEPSWYWLSSKETARLGTSYFTSALAIGAGLMGGFAADQNNDSVITLSEMYHYLWVNQASSTVQMYPQDDSFPFLVYDRALLQENQKAELIGFVFDSTTLSPENPMLTLEYTARSSTRVVYQITYLQNGGWSWNQSVTIPDQSEFDGDADPLGDISPGRKRVTLDLTDILPDGWTYAMIHVLAYGDHGSRREPFIYAARVLSAKNGGDPNLSIQMPEVWEKTKGSELELFVGHQAPCNLTIQIENGQGELIRKISTSRPTRPQVLSPEGSLFYWNGLDDQGTPVPDGVYRVVASTRLGKIRYEAQGEVILRSVR